MSKLFTLKEWLTMPDAARHLSIAFGEEVSEADVLRLALDGRLKLSVNFVNHALARCGKIVPIDDAEYKEVPSLDGKGTVRLYGGVVLYTGGEKTHVVKLEEMVQLAGIYDLPMIGGERLDIEHKYQMLTNGVEVSLVNMDGAFVEGKNGVVCQLLSSNDDNEFYAGSLAQLEKLKQHIANNNIEAAEADKLVNRHKEDRKEFLEQKKSQPASESYEPAGSLPDDSVLVVRTNALREMEVKIKVRNTARLDSKGIQQDWDKSSLTDYFLFDYWDVDNAFEVLVGLDYYHDPEKAINEHSPVPLDFMAFMKASMDGNDGNLSAELTLIEMRLNVERLRKFWLAGDNDAERYSPSFFIEWSLSKHFRPEWLDWAIERGLYIPIKKAEEVIKKIDLIDLISLSKIIVEQESMAIGEAFHYIYTILKKNADKIKLFDTSPATLPQEIKDADNILQEVWNTNWWCDAKLETASFNAFAPSVHEVAILKADASKAFTIPFDVFAHGLCNTLQVVEQPAQTTGTNKIAPADNAAPLAFDKASATYPPELDIALQAWRAVSTSEGKGKPKARIKAWLDTNTKLSNEAKERIAIVTNWEKAGGSTRTE